MGRFLIKQPNGRYCLFSSVVDCPIYVNLTEQDYIDIYMEYVKRDCLDYIKQVNENPCHHEIYENIDKYFHPNNMDREEFDKLKLVMETPVTEEDKFIIT